MAKAPKKKLRPGEALEAARGAPDAEAAADLVLDAFDDPAALARQLWDWTRQGALNTAASCLYWKPMAADPSAFTASDLLDLLVKIGQEPECAGLERRGRVLPAGWRKELDALLAAVRSGPEPLVAGLKELREPLQGGLAFALAREKLLPVSAIPDRVLRELAEKLAKGDESVRREVLAALPWPKEVVAEAVAEAALGTEGRIDGLEDLLCEASASAQRRLFEKRAFGALEVLARAADKTKTWLEDHLAAQAAKPGTAAGHLDTLQRQAALAAWVRLAPPGSLPARFEPLAEFALAAPGPPSVGEVVSAASPGARERLLLGCAGRCDDLQWLDAAKLAPTPAVLAAAVEHACEAVDALAKGPELEDDLERFLDSVRKRLVALGAPLEPHLREARAKHPVQCAAAQLVGAALKGVRT